MNLTLPHHQDIWEALSCFNSQLFADKNILFGGGTRIALEINEYRKSIDIDFLCTQGGYRAVREQTTSNSIGQLTKAPNSFVFPRGIRVDRDAVRTAIKVKESVIKLEFVRFDQVPLVADTRNNLFPVPFIDRTTCFATKLLANADRYTREDKKDIFDLCMMHHAWGSIPKEAWKIANDDYSSRVIINALDLALEDMMGKKDEYLEIAERLSIHSDTALLLITQYAEALRVEVIEYAANL